jgi:hypothetical protein
VILPACAFALSAPAVDLFKLKLLWLFHVVLL